MSDPVPSMALVRKRRRVIVKRAICRPPSVAAEQVDDWLDANAEKFKKDVDPKGDTHDDAWNITCDAPKLLSALFRAFFESSVEYRKILHLTALTEWLLEHDPGVLEELSEYVEALVTRRIDDQEPALSVA
jgi:hypothetical protein